MGETVGYSIFDLRITEPVTLAGMDLPTGQPVELGGDGKARRSFEGLGDLLAGPTRIMPLAKLLRSDSSAGSAWDLDAIRRAARNHVRDGWFQATGTLDGKGVREVYVDQDLDPVIWNGPDKRDRSMYPDLPRPVQMGQATFTLTREGLAVGPGSILPDQPLDPPAKVGREVGWKGPVNLRITREGVYQVMADGTERPYDPFTGGR